MITIMALALTFTLAVLILRWIAAVPLVRTLTCAIDSWADSVHGNEAEELKL